MLTAMSAFQIPKYWKKILVSNNIFRPCKKINYNRQEKMMITCKNCNQKFNGHFCNNCGQPANTHKINSHFLWHDIQHGLLHFDKGIFHNHGLPQGPQPSGLLSEVVLSHFDTLKMPGINFRYHRYV